MITTCSEDSYYTSLRDCVVWSIGVIGGVIAIAAAITYVRETLRGTFHALTWEKSFGAIGVAFGAGLFLGLMIFAFGWMGRVTVSQAGLRAPLYSGRRVFLNWDELRTAIKGSLAGWPCVLVAGSDPKAPVYLMVIGNAKRRMIARIRVHAPATNVLIQFFAHDRA